MTANKHHAPSRLLIAGCLLTLYFVWGTTYFAIRVGLEAFAPLFQMATRFIVAGGALIVFCRLRGMPWPSRLQWRNSALLGALLMGGGMGGVSVAEQWISSGATTVMIGALPLVSALWSGVFGKWPRPLEWLALAVGSCGVAILTMGGEFRANPAGAITILAAITAWSFGSQWSRKLDLPAGSMGFAAEMLCGGAVLLVASALLGEAWHFPAAARQWLAWGWLVVLGSLLAFSAYMLLVEHTSPVLATSYAYVNPPVALLVGAWLG
ncbi:MAG: drug/metabolite exporter YedA, partial [Zoogloea sp.]|nr:drug/metabolite exporter YedA [Zoogloea sp.]